MAFSVLTQFGRICAVLMSLVFFSPFGKHGGGEQLQLARSFQALQERVGKIFTIDEVDVSASWSSTVSAERQQPTPREFMAEITVRVATHLDISADARGRSRLPLRPRSEEFSAPELDVPTLRSEAGVDAEAGPPAGADSDLLHVPAQEWSLECACRFSLGPQDVQAIAFYDEVRASSVLTKYKRDFLQRLGSMQSPVGRIGVCSYSLHGSFQAFVGSRQDLKGQQLALFDYRRQDKADGVDDPASVGVPCYASPLGDAYLTETCSPRGFVQ